MRDTTNAASPRYGNRIAVFLAFLGAIELALFGVLLAMNAKVVSLLPFFAFAVTWMAWVIVARR